MAIHETFIRLDQFFEPAGRLEGDRVYGLIIKVPRLLIVNWSILVDVINWDDQDDSGGGRTLPSWTGKMYPVGI